MMDFVKDKLSLFVALCSTLGGLLALSVHGCSGRPSVFPCSKELFCDDGYVCIDGDCIPADAGTDASDPNAEPLSACFGPCLPLWPDGWTEPRAFWHGPSDLAPKGCPVELGTVSLFVGYDEPVAEPGDCNGCECDPPPPDGECPTLPAAIEVHAATCGQPGAALPFGGPEGWDGSCTNANALPAGAKCPDGSGALCAQSVTVSPLGAPVEKECAPVDVLPPVAHSGAFKAPTWNITTIGCHVATCNDPSKACRQTVGDIQEISQKYGEKYQNCISRQGKHECPAPWLGDRFVVYEPTYTVENGFDDALIDDRQCTACTCGPPMGGICLAHFRLYEDGACSKQLSDAPIGSVGDGQCTNIIPPGLALGSKAITDLEYIPGACEPGVSEAIGTVEPDPARAVTVCCAAPTE